MRTCLQWGGGDAVYYLWQTVKFQWHFNILKWESMGTSQNVQDLVNGWLWSATDKNLEIYDHRVILFLSDSLSSVWCHFEKRSDVKISKRLLLQQFTFLSDFYQTLGNVVKIVPCIPCTSCCPNQFLSFVGHAFGLGFMLTLVHDYRVMQTGRGWLCFNEVFTERRIPRYFPHFFR